MDHAGQDCQGAVAGAEHVDRATAVLPQPRSELEHHHTRVKYVFVMGVAAAARILRANMLSMMNLLASKVLMASHVLGLFA